MGEAHTVVEWPKREQTSDTVAFCCLYLSICVSLHVRLGWSLPLCLLLGLVTGVQQSIQCGWSDMMRLFIVDLGYGGNRLEGEEPEHSRRKLEDARARGSGWFIRLLLRLHHLYVRQQWLLIRSSLRLRQRLGAALHVNPSVHAAFQRRYLEETTRLAPLRAWVSPNSYHVALAVSSFVPFLLGPVPLHGLGTGLFLVYVWLLDLVLVLCVLLQARVDRRLGAELERPSHPHSKETPSWHP